MHKSYDATRDDDHPDVGQWSERIFSFTRRRLIRLGVDQDEVLSSAFKIGKVINTNWQPPEDDDE